MTQKTQYYVEWCSIKPDISSFYNIPEIKGRSKSLPQINVVKKCIDNRKFVRLKSALNYLIISSNRQTVYCKKQKRTFDFKLNFITLTLSQSQQHSDKYIKKNMLDPFLKWLMYRGATGYVWKAERQKNQNLHFHITTNKFIHYQDIRNKWNHIQWKNGYLKKYQDEHNSIDPNSTDVKSIIHTDKAVRYMFKYILKKENGKDLIEGHNYGYSRNLAQIKIRIPTLSNEFETIFQYLQSIQIYKMHFEYVTCMYHSLIDFKKCPDVLKRMIQEAMNKNKKHSSTIKFSLSE